MSISTQVWAEVRQPDGAWRAYGIGSQGDVEAVSRRPPDGCFPQWWASAYQRPFYDDADHEFQFLVDGSDPELLATKLGLPPQVSGELRSIWDSACRNLQEDPHDEPDPETGATWVSLVELNSFDWDQIGGFFDEGPVKELVGEFYEVSLPLLNRLTPPEDVRVVFIPGC